MRTVESAQRDDRACRMRARRCSYQQISDTLGYGSASNARRAVQDALARITQDSAEELRIFQLEQLDYLTGEAIDVIEAQQPLVTMRGEVVLNGQGKEVPDLALVVQAMTLLLRIQGRQAKLMNLDLQPKEDEIPLAKLKELIARLDAALGDEGETGPRPGSDR